MHVGCVWCSWLRLVREKCDTRPDWPPGQVQVFIHGEAQAVMHNLRPYVRKERGVDAKWASISGYWRRGRTEETFRQWKAELAAAEAAEADWGSGGRRGRLGIRSRLDTRPASRVSRRRSATVG